jgi:valyl-tRNA synthetase
VQALDLALADLRFDEAANTIYQFVWSRFCDWYLELIKPVLQRWRGRRRRADETRAVAGWVLDQILVMLHPFMPFITEELWSKMGAREHELIVAKWPMADARALDPDGSAGDRLADPLVSEIRAARTNSMSHRAPAYRSMSAALQSRDQRALGGRSVDCTSRARPRISFGRGSRRRCAPDRRR